MQIDLKFTIQLVHPINKKIIFPMTFTNITNKENGRLWPHRNAIITKKTPDETITMKENYL